MTEASAAEVHPNPYPAELVGEDIDVVVAAPHGAELSACLLLQGVSLVLAGDRVPRRIGEQRIVDRSVVGLAGAANAEADLGLNFVGDACEVVARVVGDSAVSQNCSVTARDIEADP